VEGLRTLLSPDGIVNMEFPHLMRLVEGTQFDTIYHEHFSYFSLHTVNRIFSTHNLEVFDVDELSTHGGSLRIYARHQRAGGRPPSPAISRLLREEEYRGMLNTDFYRGFQKKVDEVKYQLVSFLIGQRKAGKTVVGYGAAAKGNTLLNYCGIRKDLIPFVADVSPYKQGKYLPGVHIPVFSPERVKDVRPDFVLILPWNLKEEISEALAHIRNWGGNFVIPIPEVITF
jgi:hypothetical protein